MDNIIIPNADYDFSQIILDNPAPLHGGSFFTKIKFADKGLPLYVQFPKCVSKSGVNKNNASKKTSIDLQFNYFETDILTWMENLENKCRELIYEKRELWFQSEMLEEDIESMFISPIKPYRSGKFLIIRTYIPTSKHIRQEGCLIYDENERMLDSNSINETTQFIPLVHIEGIKFSAKSFQIEINIRQIMVLSLEDNIKKNCLIKNNLVNTTNKETTTLDNKSEVLDNKSEVLDNKSEILDNKSEILDNKSEILDKQESSTLETFNINQQQLDKLLPTNVISNNNLHEISLDIDTIDQDDNISLKKPKDVYYEIYKAAYDKAKQIKKAAIEAHLEAKNIKVKYNLNNINESDDELDTFLDIES
jgi:hypothetical protein